MSGRPAARAVAGLGREPAELMCAVRAPDGGDPRDGRSRFAIRDAGIRGREPSGRVGLLHAVVLGAVDLWRDFYTTRDGPLSVHEYLALMARCRTAGVPGCRGGFPGDVEPVSASAGSRR